MLTAGGGDQQVADGGPNGHSVFTWTLMQALEGNGDLNGDGVITGAELGAYVGPIVSSLAMQTPAFGSMPGSQGGEFVFELKPESEFLSSQSQELDQEAVRLNTEIAKLRAAITAKAERNRKLKQELGAAQSTLANGETAVATRAASPRESASTHNDRGTALFREKKYAQAALAFQAAVELDPDSALAANNLGFAHYKLGTHALAVEWFEKTVRIDPQRAIAYYNLGDAYFELNRLEDARKSYETFLALQPNAKAAPQARERLRSLAAQ
jgi:tetratricopeptide (TPR) repeat protein